MDLIEEIGPFVGLAAFVGLAVLAFLLFQQSRDLRRLREWAGRAPERAKEAADASLAAAELRGEEPEETGPGRISRGWTRGKGLGGSPLREARPQPADRRPHHPRRARRGDRRRGRPHQRVRPGRRRRGWRRQGVRRRAEEGREAEGGGAQCDPDRGGAGVPNLADKVAERGGQAARLSARSPRQRAHRLRRDRGHVRAQEARGRPPSSRGRSQSSSGETETQEMAADIRASAGDARSSSWSAPTTPSSR